MAEQLSTEQVLLLNNLMYMTSNDPLSPITSYSGKTIGEVINSIDVNKLSADSDYGSYMTGDDWKNLVNAVQADEQLMNVQVAQTYTDNSEVGGGGVSALFTDPSTNEAIVCYRGTASSEWQDNFIGGGPTDTADGVSTNNQMGALEWYQSLDLEQYDTVTVTGHSKGGNKAKYITIMDDSVDRCLSFDGQGFSDEFIDKYSDKIAENQGKIENHNVGDDYVNLLLNDVGETHFYKGYDLGKGKYLENHCPNTFFKFNEDGTVTMTPGTRSKAMAEIDDYFNSYLRNLDPEQKQGTLKLIGKLVEMGFDDDTELSEVLKTAFQEENMDYFADLIAYTIRYDQQNVGLISGLEVMLAQMGAVGIFATAIIGGVRRMRMADPLWDLKLDILDYAYWLEYLGLSGLEDLLGLELSAEEFRKLVEFLHKINTRMDTVDVTISGADKKVKSVKRSSASGSGGSGKFKTDPSALERTAAELSGYVSILISAAEKISSTRSGLDDGIKDVKPVLKELEQSVEKQKSSLQSLSEALENISAEYDKTENNIIGMMNA